MSAINSAFFLCVQDIDGNLEFLTILTLDIFKEQFSHSNRAGRQYSTLLLDYVLPFGINWKYLPNVNKSRLSSFANGEGHFEFLCLLKITQNLHICIENPIYNTSCQYEGLRI